MQVGQQYNCSLVGVSNKSPATWYNLPAMHIELLYDLQTDPHDERQAEFDPPSTIEALRHAL